MFEIIREGAHMEVHFSLKHIKYIIFVVIHSFPLGGSYYPLVPYLTCLYKNKGPYFTVVYVSRRRPSGVLSLAFWKKDCTIITKHVTEK
jgi:hypothetical protein